MLTVEEVATHFALRPDTVRRKIRNGELEAFRVRRQYRCQWHHLWACEQGKMPGKPGQARYQVPLLRKKIVAGKIKVDEKTVERWVALGMPTRNVFGSVRFNPYDITDWLLQKEFVTELPEEWWLD
jgi:excisionase family DNA binding protein